MKLFTSFLFLIAVPLVFLITLFTVIVPLMVQHFFSPKSSDSAEYPYLTSWEEAA